jgi:secreted trypsin-like serine protease
LNGTSIHPPIAINRNSDLWDPNAADVQVTAMGMGWIDKDGSPLANRLREVNLTVVPNEICEQTQSDEDSYEGRIGKSHLCTFSPHKDSCAYDSGSPIILTPQHKKEPHLLVGMVSWGMECADTVFPAVNSRISVASEWIDSIVCEWSENPPKDFGCYPSVVPVLTPTTTKWNQHTMRGDADIAFILIMCLMAAVGSRLWWGRFRRCRDYEELK